MAYIITKEYQDSVIDFSKQKSFLSFGKGGLILDGIFNFVSFSKHVQDHMFHNFLYSMESWGKEIEIINRLFLVIDMYCQASSSQFKSVQWITKPTTLLAGWEDTDFVCSNRWQTRDNLILFKFP